MLKRDDIFSLCFISMLFILSFVFSPAENNLYFEHNNKKYELPSSCPSYWIFNAPCPGCGMSRSFSAISRGRFKEAWKYNRVSILLYFLFLLHIIYRIIRLIIPESFSHPLYSKIFNITGYLVMFLLFLNWILFTFFKI